MLRPPSSSSLPHLTGRGILLSKRLCKQDVRFQVISLKSNLQFWCIVPLVYTQFKTLTLQKYNVLVKTSIICRENESLACRRNGWKGPHDGGLIKIICSSHFHVFTSLHHLLPSLQTIVATPVRKFKSNPMNHSLTRIVTLLIRFEHGSVYGYDAFDSLKSVRPHHTQVIQCTNIVLIHCPALRSQFPLHQMCTWFCQTCTYTIYNEGWLPWIKVSTFVFNSKCRGFGIHCSKSAQKFSHVI